MQIVQIGVGLHNGVQDLVNGNYSGALLNLANAGLSIYQLSKACFAAGTKLLTPDGPKPIEQFELGDKILTRLEWDPTAPTVVSEVEAKFESIARMYHLHLESGAVIRTTGEHSFYLVGWGWLAEVLLQY
ncbi:hypothetical protein HRbin36_02021 [bacterium HR36]|nr:hypothetical protein HRbin36_02021 [bacterium HR36]